MLLYDHILWLLLLALFLDGLVGDPDWLWRRLPHPVVWIGKAIAVFDTNLNRPNMSARFRRFAGTLSLMILVFIAIAIGVSIHLVASTLPSGDAITVVVAAVLIAQKSLYQHVAAVRDGLRDEGLEGGRRAVAMIVGRDPQQLDGAGVSRAAIESCAENYSDGVVAPVFWFALLGLPGLIAYKTINTADSMIGHKTEKHLDFGWASARLDDLVNLPASRLSGVLFALSAPVAGGRITESLACIFKDASKHRSPNAGWPEAAMAGALGIALAGPRSYPGYQVNDPYMNENGRKDASATDIERSLKLLCGACVYQAFAVVLMIAMPLSF